MRERHVAVARFVTDYEFNNTYQYIIAREDVHLSWLEAALDRGRRKSRRRRRAAASRPRASAQRPTSCRS